MRVARVSEIVRAASDLFDVPVGQILGKGRSIKAARARFAVTWVAQLRGIPPCVIAIVLGRRPLSSVGYARLRAESLASRDPAYRENCLALLHTASADAPANLSGEHHE